MPQNWRLILSIQFHNQGLQIAVLPQGYLGKCQPRKNVCGSFGILHLYSNLLTKKKIQP